MQKQDAGLWNSGCLGSHRQSAVAMPAAKPLTVKIILAIFLTVACPGMLIASDETVPAGTPKLPHSPPQAVPSAATTTLTTVKLNTLFFDFGNNLVGNKLEQTAVVVTNTGKSTLNLAPALAGDASFKIAASKSCGTTLAAGKSCDVMVTYLPTLPSYPKAQSAMLSLNFANADAGVPGAVAIVGTSAKTPTGIVTPTRNPQVALYSMTLPFPGRMKINFGLTTSYGLKTWFQDTDVNHGVISILVAGMQAQKIYHMAATVELTNGITWTDADHKFRTGVVPQVLVFPVTTKTTSGMTPQPGIEMTNPLKALEAYDLQGNLIWTYAAPTPDFDYIDGSKMLPNGDVLLTLGALSNAPLLGTIGTNVINEIREINLAGDTVRELSVTDLNAALQYAPASCKECWDAPGVPLTLQTFHHDITPLPNGHWLILSNEMRMLSPTTTPPLTGVSKPTAVIGDVVVDVDENLQPVWVWNEFNWLKPNRQPMGFPDWTHSNAVLYSPDDDNFLISIRHQNWVIKVNYKGGRGDGRPLWKLGHQGDFQLIGGSDPVDWQYAQHEPNFFSPNTTGVFELGLMDNGDDRAYAAGDKCTAKNPPASCTYTTIPVFKINEEAKTATLVFHHKLPTSPTSLYSNFGGNAERLANGDIEYDLCGLPTPVTTPVTPPSSLVQEVKQDPTATVVWQMSLTNGNFYRAYRIPSLYPNVQW